MEYGIKTKPQQQLQMIEADLKRLNVLELANCQRNKRIRYMERTSNSKGNPNRFEKEPNKTRNIK